MELAPGPSGCAMEPPGRQSWTEGLEWDRSSLRQQRKGSLSLLEGSGMFVDLSGG